MTTLPHCPDAHALAEALALLCEDAHPYQDGWRARCPSHQGESDTSLSVDPADDRVVLHCFGGCDQQAVVQALGLTLADLFVTSRAARTNGHRRIVQIYPYHDAHGHVVHETVRYDHPKSFKQRRPDPAHPGAYLWSLKGIEPVLYHLPAVLAAMQAGALVHVAEGEKDAETLTRLGLTATTAPMGAGKWRESYTATLTGADVLVWPDNDAAGAAHVAMVTGALDGKARRVRVVTVPSPHKDVSDWVQAGATKADVEALIQTATVPPAAPAGVSTGGMAWEAVLFRLKTGELHETENNLQAIFAHHPFWEQRLWWDVVAGRAYLDDRQPLDIHYVRNEVSPWLGATMRMPIRHGHKVLEVMRSWSQRQPRDPIQEWLGALPAQDETDLDRTLLDTWLHTYGGAEDTPYSRFVSRILIVSLVQRAMSPGIQYRYVVVLEGEENVGKTQLLMRLGDRWHQEFPKSVEGKEAYMQLQGYWLVELGELDALKPAQESRIKMFISQQMDRWIPKYENDLREVPRRCTLVGTTNEREYLKGEHGNTRYFPLWLDGPIDLAAITAVRDRLFTQGKHFLADHPDDWWCIPDDVEDELRQARKARQEPSIFDDKLAPFCAQRTRATVAEALEYLLIPTGQWSKRLEMEVGKAFKANDWYRHVERDATTKKTKRFWANAPQQKQAVPF